jgi:large subunit ribosomal protein L19
MNAIAEIERKYAKPALPQVQSGDTVRVHQLIKEGQKQRIQVFEGVVIRRHRMNSVTATITVRRIASGVGVEKTFLLHSPNVAKVEILRRAKVRRNFLSFLRERRGKSARLKEVAFDKAAANDVSVPEVPEEIDAEENEDALNDAEPLQNVESAEAKEVAAEDVPNATASEETSDEQQAPAEEVDEGLGKAEPGEGKAVQS